MNSNYARRYNTVYSIKLNGRKKQIFDEILWVIDIYSNSQQEYNKFVSLLENCILAYKEMKGEEVKYVKQGTIGEYKKEEIEVEVIEDKYTIKDKIVNFIRDKKECEYDLIETEFKDIDVEEWIEQLKKSGDIFEYKNGSYKVLE